MATLSTDPNGPEWSRKMFYCLERPSGMYLSRLFDTNLTFSIRLILL